MQEILTQHEQWIRYYYNECDLIESDRLQRNLDGDPIMATEYQELVEVLDQLTLPGLQPSEECVQRILQMA